MLSRLFIKNVAVIESAEIEFGAGFNILTGETGAGKSIIIDSLNMLKGERAGRDLIRSGEQRARVDGVFDLDEKTAGIIEEEFGVEITDGELVISREINADGKNTARVNGMPVAGAVLKELGTYLINIHGQHDNTSLLSKKTHLPLLDSVSADNVCEILEKYKKVHNELAEKRAQLNSIKTDEQEKIRRLDMLNFQIDEIEAAAPEIGEDDELNERRTFLENAAKIAENTARASAYLYDGEETQKSVNDLLWESIGMLGEVAEYDGQLKSICDEMTDIAYELSDKMRSLRKYSDTLTFNPHELNQLEDRLDLIYSLKRKYGATIELVLQYLEDAKKEADSIVRSDEIEKELVAEIESLNAQRTSLAEKLTTIRIENGKKLSAGVEAQLKDLDMARVRFTVRIEPADFSSTGADDVEFLICTNVGEDFKPLTKIASGGELSRIMLAIKSMLTGTEMLRTLVFDEVDTGVSGYAAQKTGEKLRMVAQESQVICVTHLPQIAALAKNHYLIEKKVESGRTLTSVKLLSYQERISELARTLGGSVVTDITLANAKELLKQAGN